LYHEQVIFIATTKIDAYNVGLEELANFQRFRFVNVLLAMQILLQLFNSVLMGGKQPWEHMKVRLCSTKKPCGRLD
jgi:hypothetical protein